MDYRWQNFLQAVREEKMFVASSLEFGAISSLKDNTLTISFPKKYSFYKENLERTGNKKVIEEKAKEIFRRNLNVKFVLERATQATKEETSTVDKETSKKSTSEPIIDAALKIFQGRVIGRSRLKR